MSVPAAARLAVVVLFFGSALAPLTSAHGLPPIQRSTAAPNASVTATTYSAAALPAPTAPGSLVRDPAGLLPGLPWESAGAAVSSSAGTAWRPLLIGGAPAAPGQQGTLQFWCPSLDGVPSINDGTNTLTLRGSCPYRVIDDADLLGSPQIAVNAADPNAVAFFSLHGGGSTEGPTPRSRDPSPDGMAQITGLSHTTFTSQDMGRSWHDNPWGTDGFGEHVSGTMDADGNLYIGALWSKRLGEGRFDYVIKLYKEQDGRYTISTYQPSKTYSNRASGNTIDEANVVYLQAPIPDVPENATGNGTGNATAPADPSQIGNHTLPGDYGSLNSAEDRVMAVWFEKALDWRNATTHKSSWIDAAWTDTSARDNWTRLKDDQLIGPCMEASNPVPWHGKAYVACVADAGYNGRSRARIGDIDVWSIDPKTGKTHLEEYTGLVGGNPRMASRADGYMAVASVDVKDEQNVDVQVSYGWYGAHWQGGLGVQNVGSDLHRLAGGNRVREARITAMALEKERSNLFLSYMERTRFDANKTPDPNPTTLNTSPTQTIEYHKIVATMTQCQSGPIDVYDLQLGVARHPFSDGTTGDTTGVFDDLQDGMQFWQDPDTGEERVYFAYGDHGVIQYGALVGTSTTFSCPIVAPPVTLPPPPIPAALSTASPYSMLVGATVGTTALAMVTYLLAAKKKTATFASSKSKR